MYFVQYEIVPLKFLEKKWEIQLAFLLKKETAFSFYFAGRDFSAAELSQVHLSKSCNEQEKNGNRILLKAGIAYGIL